MFYVGPLLTCKFSTIGNQFFKAEFFRAVKLSATAPLTDGTDKTGTFQTKVFSSVFSVVLLNM